MPQRAATSGRGPRRARLPVGSRRWTLASACLLLGGVAVATPAAAQRAPSPRELHALEAQALSPDPADAQGSPAGEVSSVEDPGIIESSRGGAPLPQAASAATPVRSDPDRVVLGVLAVEAMSGLAFVAGLVGCLFDDDDADSMGGASGPDSDDHVRTCVLVAATVGFSIGSVAGLGLIHDGEAFPSSLALAFTGGLVGAGAALALTLATDVHAGVDAVYWLTLPVLSSVLFYEVSGRRRRRRRALEASLAPVVSPRLAGASLRVRY